MSRHVLGYSPEGRTLWSDNEIANPGEPTHLRGELVRGSDGPESIENHRQIVARYRERLAARVAAAAVELSA